MKGADRFLIAIVGAVLLLVTLAFIAVVRRPPATFREENTVENIAYNYLFALQQQDYGHAYAYLSPSLKGYPGSVEQFARDISNSRYRFTLDDASSTLEIESHRTVGSLEQVAVRETQLVKGPLLSSSQSSNVFRMDLQFENGAWKIVDSDRYWAPCWTENNGCR